MSQNLRLDCAKHKVDPNKDMIRSRILELCERAENIVNHYNDRNQQQNSYQSLLLLEKEVDYFFDLFQGESFDPSEVILLTKLCRTLNEDKILQEIRTSYLQDQNLENDFSLSKQNPKSDCKNALSDVDLNQEGFHKISDIYSNLQKISPNNSNTDIDNEGLSFKKEIAFSNNKGEEVEYENQSENAINIENILKELEELFYRIKEEYDESRIENAYTLVEKAELMTELNQNKPEIHNLMDLKIKEHENLINIIKLLHKECMALLYEMETEKGYHLEKIKDNFTIKYKSVAGEQIGLKMEGSIEAPLFNMLALVNEPEGYVHWMPFCKEALLVSVKEKQLTRTSKAFWVKCSMPPPIFGREWHIFGTGFDRINRNGSVLLIAKSIHSVNIYQNSCILILVNYYYYFFFKIPIIYSKNKTFQSMFGLNIPLTSKTTRMELEYLGMELIPLSKNKTRIKIVSKFDPKIKYLPLPFVNWVVRKMAQYLLDRLVKKATNLQGSIWEKRIAENKAFYGWLELKVEQFLSNRQLCTEMYPKSDDESSVRNMCLIRQASFALRNLEKQEKNKMGKKNDNSLKKKKKENIYKFVITFYLFKYSHFCTPLPPAKIDKTDIQLEHICYQGSVENIINEKSLNLLSSIRRG